VPHTIDELQLGEVPQISEESNSTETVPDAGSNTAVGDLADPPFVSSPWVGIEHGRAPL